VNIQKAVAVEFCHLIGVDPNGNRGGRVGAPLNWEDRLQDAETLINLVRSYGEKDAPKINWRDDPEAFVEDDEPQVGRDYA
jgi:hypothetical protein